MTTIISGIFGGGDAATRAADIQAQATGQAVGEQRRQFEATQQNLAPFREAALPALQQQQALLGLTGQEAQQEAIGAIQESPGQRFIRGRAQRNLLQNAAAVGGLGGGNIRSALVEQGAGFAQQDLGNQFQRLQALSGGGQQAATNIAGFGQQAASNIGNLQVARGQAQAQGVLQKQQADANLAGQLLQIGGGAAAGGAGVLGPGIGAGGGAALALISDKRLKRDVRDLTPEECYEKVCNMKLKAWKYIKALGIDDKEHYGVMAQDAPEEIKIEGREALNLHDELSLIAGAFQYMKKQGVANVI